MTSSSVRSVRPPASAITKRWPGLHVAAITMRETLCLDTAGVISSGHSTVDADIGRRRIDRGAGAVVDHVAGRDTPARPDRPRFHPDRFDNSSGAQRALSDRAWVPFGGVANRVGSAPAQLEPTFTTTRGAQHLDLEPVAGVVARPVGMVVNRPRGGALMRLARR